MKKSSYYRLWFIVFGFWFLFLSGILTQLTGSPGVLQLMRLKNLKVQREKQIVELKTDIQRLEYDAKRLEKNSVVQEQEIRRVLGYAAKDEIIFDFSSVDQLH
ncbi:MAG: septum formation initiator family protein [Deltaproteobacteria bacterium]|nr:septum formation initiator family protein [Deltaproteobacteria bacterium]